MSEINDSTVKSEREALLSLFSKNIIIGSINKPRGHGSPQLLDNLKKIALGNQLVEVYQCATEIVVASRGNSAHARNRAASIALLYIQKIHRINPGRARQLMQVAKRFRNDLNVLETFSWTELRMLIPHDDLTVQKAMDCRRSNPKMTKADFSEWLKLFRTVATESNAQSA